MRSLQARLPTMRRRALGVGPGPQFEASRRFPVEVLALEHGPVREWVDTYLAAVRDLAPERSQITLQVLDDDWADPHRRTVQVRLT